MAINSMNVESVNWNESLLLCALLLLVTYRKICDTVLWTKNALGISSSGFLKSGRSRKSEKTVSAGITANVKCWIRAVIEVVVVAFVLIFGVSMVTHSVTADERDPITGAAHGNG